MLRCISNIESKLKKEKEPVKVSELNVQKLTIMKCATEGYMESIRKKLFSGSSSRLASCFLSLDIEWCKKFANQWRGSKSVLYEVNIEESKVSVFDYSYYEKVYEQIYKSLRCNDFKSANSCLNIASNMVNGYFRETIINQESREYLCDSDSAVISSIVYDKS